MTHCFRLQGGEFQSLICIPTKSLTARVLDLDVVPFCVPLDVGHPKNRTNAMPLLLLLCSSFVYGNLRSPSGLDESCPLTLPR